MPLESLNLARGANTKEKEAFQATPDELRAIHEKMKDPVFVDLMKDYMTSLADPETRKEEEAYLEQAEREAREGGDYSYQFVFPRPAFVVELVKPTTTRISAEEVKRVAGSKHALPSSVRTYLNICTSDKIDEFREETTGNRMGSNWHVPVSVSARRTEFFVPNNSTSAPSASSNGGGGGGGDDDGGSNTAANIASPPSNAPLCYVHDAVFHPKTAALADRSDRFLCFLVEIAVEHLNNGYKESHGFEFSRLSSSITSIGLPKNQTIRSTNGKNPFAVDPNAPVLTKPTKHLDAAVPPSSSPPPPPPATTQKKKKEAEVEPSTTPDAQHRLPPFTITHRGHIDFTDAWQWKVADRRVGVPEELVVRLTFNEIRKASALDVCITEDGGALQVERSGAQKLYEGLIVLPFTVEQSPTSARFDPATHVLTLVLRVVPPPAPEGAISAEELRRELHGPAITPLKEEEEAKEASSADAAPVKEAAAGVPTTSPAPTTATSTSTPSEAVKEAVAAAPAPMKEAVVGAPVPDATTTAAAPVKEAAPSATTTTAEVGAPVVDHISDASRVQAMMAQVMEARKAREAAAAIISTKSPSVQSATPPLPSTPPAEEVEVAAAPSPNPCDGTGVQPSVTEPESIPFIKKARSEADVEEEAALVARQKAWQEMMAAQMEEMAAVEAKAVERAQQKAARQSAQAARRLAEEKELEKLEMRARAKMEALPLRNKYLFAID